MKTLLRCSAISLAALTLSLGCGDDGGDGGGEADAAPDTADASGDNAAPAAAMTFDPECTDSDATVVTFASASTDADGDTLTCSWTFASGTPSTSTECEGVEVTFPSVAPYDVTLTVDDGNGNTDAVTESIAPC